MSDITSNNPVFTIVMGCNGVGKSAWKRSHFDELPERFIDQDSLAGGLGDWNKNSSRERARPIVEEKLETWIKGKHDFGIESTFSGLPGVTLMERVLTEGYVVRGFYMGTNDPSINIERIEYRVLMNTGHQVDPERIPQRHTHSLSNLRRKWDEFEELTLLDNSTHSEIAIPVPIEQCYVQRGVVQELMPREQMATWASILLNRIDEQRQQRANQREHEERKRQRGLSR